MGESGLPSLKVSGDFYTVGPTLEIRGAAVSEGEVGALVEAGGGMTDGGGLGRLGTEGEFEEVGIAVVIGIGCGGLLKVAKV